MRGKVIWKGAGTLPAAADAARASPEGLLSRPKQMVGCVAAATSLINDPNADAKSIATPGVMVLPTIPRTPETESINGAFVGSLISFIGGKDSL